MKLEKSTLRKIQMIQLGMLEEVDRICQKCNIRYNIIAGTLLGAVRHGGYIPWDDDADIALLRPEYELFRNACEKELDKERFYFQDHRNTKGYRWGYGKLRRKHTLFVREYQEHMPYEQGIFIDIFPLENVPDNYWKRSIQNFECFCLRKALWSEVGRIAERNIIKKLLYLQIAKIPEKYLFKLYHKLIQKSNMEQGRMVRILMFPTPNSEYGYYRSWYENSKRIKFEGKWLIGIKEYDSYLTFKFGNYKELPPVGERKVHPVSKVKII